MKKKTFLSELAYVFGVVILALGTAFMERADFGVSMVVAPAYILHLKISEFFSFFTFGMAEYCFQALLLIIIAVIMRKFKLMYLFSFVTAIVYGFTLDGCMLLVGLIPMDALNALFPAGAVVFLVPIGEFVFRIVFFIVGMLLCSLGVSLLFHTYIAPEAYELMVKEFSAKTGKDIHKVKTVYDISSCLVAVLMSFAFFGLFKFRGVNVGTAITALLNGFIIGRFSKLFEKNFEFKDGLPLRKFFM